MLAVGTVAPDFHSKTSAGDLLSLSAFRGKKNVVLYFYPKDFTAVCTRESCGFSELMRELGDEHTAVIGVSTDSDDSHERFRAEYNLQFALLSDADLTIAKAYQATHFVSSLVGLKRVTYVIDREGVIRAAISGLLDAEKHVQGARAALATLA